MGPILSVEEQIPTLTAEVLTEPLISAEADPVTVDEPASLELAATEAVDEDEYYPLYALAEPKSDAAPAQAALESAETGELQSDELIYQINLDDADGQLIELAHVDLHLDSAEHENEHTPVETAPQALATPATLIWDDEPEIVVYSGQPHEIAAIDLDAVEDEANAIEAVVQAEPETVTLTSALVPAADSTENTHASIATQANAENAETAIPQVISPDTIAEITASVGAQLAIDVASEIEQLTKQHFTALMNQFYGETMRKLTEEISNDLEARLRRASFN